MKTLIPNLCKFLEWDSNFWGIRTAQVEENSLTAEQIPQIDEWCLQNQIECLYFLAQADDPVTTRLAESNGFHLTDVRMTFERDKLTPAHRLNFPNSTGTLPITVQVCRPEDIPSLEKITQGNYRQTRFYYDGNFPRPLCDKLYTLWIKQSCEGQADLVLVARLGEQPVGFITCQLNTPAPGIGRIGLFGVSATAQRQGIGPKLVVEALKWFEQQTMQKVVVITQGRNSAAQRLYQRCGFVTNNVQLWYHKWFS